MKHTKQLLLIPLALGALATGCNKKETTKTDLYVFAAASMTECLQEIKGMYEKKHTDVNLVYNLDSSGTLKTQISQGAECDLFISAAPKQMNALEEENLINKETRVNLLENKVALAVPNGNPKQVTSFDNLAERLKADESGFLLAMGNEDVPVGQYTQKILKYYDIDEEAIASHITYGSNVKAVTTAVSEGGVACGVIYQTDAFSAKLTVVDTATKDMCGQVIYPAAVTANTKQFDLSKAFLDYLKGDEAMAVFTSVGFSKM